MNDVKISVIVPIYNAQNYLERCIKSILNQSYQNLEVLLINDGSIDSSMRICEKYAKIDSRIVLYNNINHGVSYTRNFGIHNATGDYLFFVDADDIILENALEKMICCAQKENVDIVRGNYLRNGEKFERELEYLNNYNLINRKVDKNDENLIDALINYTFNCATWLLLIKRELLSDIEFDTEFGYGEDLIFTLELFLKANSIYFLNEYIYCYYPMEGSATRNSKLYKRNVNNLIRLPQIINNILRKHNMSNEIRIKTICSTYSYMAIWYEYLMLKENVQTKQQFKKSLCEMRNIFLQYTDKYITPVSKYMPKHIELISKLFYNKKFNSIIVLLKIKDGFFKKKSRKVEKEDIK